MFLAKFTSCNGLRYHKIRYKMRGNNPIKPFQLQFTCAQPVFLLVTSDGLRWRVVYKFACAGCNACYVGETTRHFSTRVREHLVSDRASHIFKHLENSEHCHDLCSVDCFHILDHASTTFQLKIKEAFHIRREQPFLNQQLHHVNLKLSL